jgi:hypothetical protein
MYKKKKIYIRECVFWSFPELLCCVYIYIYIYKPNDYWISIYSVII